MGLFPLALVMLTVLALPPMAAALLGSRIRRRTGNPAAFWFCVGGWFVLCGTFAFLCRRYWRAYAAAV